MVQNRNKLIDLLIGNLSNAVLHRILEQSVEDEDLSRYYEKEILNSVKIAKKYREKINPATEMLPREDSENIRNRVIERVNNKLKARIEEGYKNIDLASVEEAVEKLLSEMNDYSFLILATKKPSLSLS